MIIDRHAAIAAFNDYVRNYDSSKEKIRLKIEHTYKVCSLCEEIAKSEHLSHEDTNLAWLIGLLHDIGRFEQLRRFNTFIDAESIDHAVFGAKLLFDDGEIRRFISDSRYDALIKTAIENHSLYRLSNDLTAREIMFSNILRDADKVDILRVNVQFPLEEIYNVSSHELRNAQISPEVMQSFFEEHATLRSLKKTSVDNLAGHISLIYELVYPYSVKAMVSQGFIDKMLDFKSDNLKTREQVSVIKTRVNSYIKRRLSELD